MNQGTIRLTIADGDHHDIPLVPFNELTVDAHVRIFERQVEETKQDYLTRALGVPQRFARIMRAAEVDKVVAAFEQWTQENDTRIKSLGEVHATLKDFAEANGREWNLDDAKAVLQQHAVFRDRITIEGRTFIAPHRIDVETQAGQWADLEDAMNVDEDAPQEQRATESETYVKVLSILMREVTGHDDSGAQILDFGYPAQRSDESDNAFAERLGNWITDRRALFMRAPWVDVMGCAAFFFSKSDYCALYTSRRWTLFQGLIRPPMPPAPNGMRAVGADISSFGKPQGTT